MCVKYVAGDLNGAGGSRSFLGSEEAVITLVVEAHDFVPLLRDLNASSRLCLIENQFLNFILNLILIHSHEDNNKV